MNAHALPGFDSFLLRDLPDDGGYDAWEAGYLDRPAAELAAEYAGGANEVAVKVADIAMDDEAFTDAMAEAYARFKGHASAAEYLAERARNDDFWLSNRFEQACEDARLDFEQDQADAGRDW